MKRFIKPALIKAAMISIMIAVTGCGSDDEGGPALPGAPGGPAPYVGGTVVPLPNGGFQIGFQGTNVYYNPGIILTGGQVSSNRCNTATGQGCPWSLGYPVNGISYTAFGYSTCFSQPVRNYMGFQTGTVTAAPIGGVPGVGTPGYQFYTGTSPSIPGATVRLATSQIGQYAANVLGVLEIPPTFIQAYPQTFPQGAATPILGVAFDFGIQPAGALNGGYYYAPQPTTTSTVTGGVLIYTSGDAANGFSGVYFKF